MLPLTLLPEKWIRHAFIAGGWAACPALASDIDVWVKVIGDPNMVDEDLIEARTALLMHLAENGYSFTTQSETEVFERGEAYDGIGLEIRKVAMVTGVGGTTYPQPVHIMVVNGTVEEVLAHFDVSTHQVALTPWGIVKGSHFSDVTRTPYVFQTNKHTRERLKKITARFTPKKEINEDDECPF